MTFTHPFARHMFQVLALALALCVSAAGAAEAAKRYEANAISKIDPAKLKPGQNLIDRNAAGFSLYCVANKGQPLSFIIKDPNGKVIPSTLSRSATTCWECGKDASGNTQCWKVPCPVIVGPWNPGKIDNLKAIQ